MAIPIDPEMDIHRVATISIEIDTAWLRLTNVLKRNLNEGC